MTLLLRAVRLIALAIWVGSLVFFAFGVAQVAFREFHDPHLAGTMVRGSIAALHRIGVFAGLAYLLTTLALLATQRDSHPARAIELALIVAMISLTLYSQFSVLPRMEADRTALNGDEANAPASDPAKQHFERLHRLSVKLEGAVLIEGLLLLCLAPLHGRDYDRFSD